MNFSNEQVKRILKERPDKPYTDGVNLYILFNDQVYKKPIDHYNSSFNVMHWRMNTVDPLDSNLSFTKQNQLEEFNFNWSLLEAEYKLLGDDTPFTRDSQNQGSSYSSALSEFLSAVELGMYPRPEVMLALSDCFQFYYDSAGKVDLEQVFFGKLKRGVGNEAAKIRSNDKYIKLAIALYFNEDNRSKKELAEDVINELGLSDSPESLIRQYNRQIKGKPSLSDFLGNFT